MADIYLYADETGNLDYGAVAASTESGYFGFGTVMFENAHGDVKEVVLRVSSSADHVVIIAGSFGTKTRATQAREAVQEVCNQIDRRITLCVWDAATSWGLQVADYALWGVHRQLVGKGGAWFRESVEPSLASTFTPWGTA